MRNQYPWKSAVKESLKTMSSNTAIIGIGSNIEPRKNIRQAIEILSSEQHLLAVSSCITTKPIGFKYQPDFLNASVAVSTSLTFNNFRDYLKSVEKRLGRVRTSNKNGPRTIDLDIIVWNRGIIDKDYFKRDFLRKTILEIMPDLEFVKEKS